MKALTVKQPWAQLIVDGIKDIENRTWRTNFRGRIYIHVSQKQPKGFANILTAEQLADFHSYVDKPVYGCYASTNILGEPWLTSAIIGEVDIIDCVQNHPSTWAEKSSYLVNFNSLPLGEEDEKPTIIWNWVLANPVKYDYPILDIKGGLSFWDPQVIDLR